MQSILWRAWLLTSLGLLVSESNAASRGCSDRFRASPFGEEILSNELLGKEIPEENLAEALPEISQSAFDDAKKKLVRRNLLFYDAEEFGRAVAANLRSTRVEGLFQMPLIEYLLRVKGRGVVRLVLVGEIGLGHFDIIFALLEWIFPLSPQKIFREGVVLIDTTQESEESFGSAYFVFDDGARSLTYDKLRELSEFQIPLQSIP